VLAKLLPPPSGATVREGADQYHHGTQVHAPAEKSHRRRRAPVAATLSSAAKAEPPLVTLTEERARDTAGLARVIGAVQHRPAMRTAAVADLSGKILIQLKEKTPELGVTQKGMGH
jgi:hypothetical protein